MYKLLPRVRCEGTHSTSCFIHHHCPIPDIDVCRIGKAGNKRKTRGEGGQNTIWFLQE